MVSAGTEHWASSKKTGDIISVRLMRDYIAAIFINYTPSSLLNEFFLQNSSENDTIKRFKNCLKNLIRKSSFRKIYIVLGIVVYEIIAKQGLNWEYCLGTIAFIQTHTHSVITILSLHSHIAHALPQDILRMIEYQKPSFPKHPGGCKKSYPEVLRNRKLSPYIILGALQDILHVPPQEVLGKFTGRYSAAI